MTPTLRVQLSLDGTLQAVLPGPSATGHPRLVPLSLDHAGTSLLTILQAQLARNITIGEDGAPTAGQIRHWERHGVFADPRCPWCADEGRTASHRSASRTRPVVLYERDGVVVRRVPAKAKGPHQPRVAGATAKSAESLGF